MDKTYHVGIIGYESISYSHRMPFKCSRYT
jgi:hypothetical protein